MQLHYCMDKLVGAGMHDSENDECGKCGMKKQDGCCKDEAKKIKIADDQKPVQQFSLTAIVADDAIPVTYNRYESIGPSKGSGVHPLINGPPKGIIGLYKYLHVFRI